MKYWLGFLCLALALSGTAADPWSLQVTNADAVVRSGILWRCRVGGAIPPSRFNDGPYLVQVSLTQGDATLVSQEHPLVRLGQLVDGLDLVLVPDTPPIPDQTVELAITVSDPGRRDSQHFTRALPTPKSLQRGLERRHQMLLQRGERDPLPALWLEQAGEAMLSGPSLATCSQLATIGEQLDRWLAGERTPGVLRAVRDPIDESVHPYRLYAVNGNPTAVVLLLADPQQTPRKGSWPAVPEAWLSGARTAGFVVVQVYPAGDLAWNGAALRRASQMLDHLTAVIPEASTLPVAVVGSGRGAAGAVALAETRPLQIKALGVINARLTTLGNLPKEAHARWMALHQPGERPAHLLSTAIVLAGERDAAAKAWTERLRLSGHASLNEVGDPGTVDFWQTLARPPLPATSREWVVLSPGHFGDALVEELNEWGVGGSLLRDADGTYRTIGITRLRLPADTTATVDGRPYRTSKPNTSSPRKTFGQATGPLPTYAQGPFSVIIGTGESEAAKADNEALAKSFVIAWANHAQGLLRPLRDHEVLDDGPVGRHLVLVGNTRSNQVLARLAPRLGLPVAWDARNLRVAGQDYLRTERRSVALCWPHPAYDGRLLVVIDGRPLWPANGLPLAGLPDLVVGGARAEDPPALERTFANDWR